VQKIPKGSGILRALLENILVGALVSLLTWMAHGVLTTEHTPLSLLRPAPGVALAAALLLGWRVAPGIFLPIAAASIWSSDSLLYDLLVPIGFVASIYMGRSLLSSQNFNPKFGSTRDVLLLAGLGAALPMGFAGVWTAGCMLLAGLSSSADFWTVAAIHWVANTAGALLVCTLILLIATGQLNALQPRPGKAVLQIAAALIAAWWAFFESHRTGVAPQALAYLPFPFLVWIALSRGLSGAALTLLGVVGIAVTATSMGHGPFFPSQPMAAAMPKNPLATFWQVEVFIAIITCSSMLIGAGSDAQRRESALQAEASTRKAELERLKAQVNPHFLFNCLAAIQSLVRTDGKAAERGLSSLSVLLRRSLDVAREPLIPLAEELHIIRESLALQKMRYEEGLEWRVSATKEAEDFLVPPMLFQPLVENAVKHGVDEGFGFVEITAMIESGALLATVRNTAPTGCEPGRWKESVGLSSVRARISDSCPEGSLLEITKTHTGQIEALLRIMPLPKTS
jgi:integral membrane sensor domain MASE1